MKRIAVLTIFSALTIAAIAQNITIKAFEKPAAEIFRSIMQQTDKNFVYSSDLLKDVRITVDLKNKPLNEVLDDVFKGTDIIYELKGKNVILKKKEKKEIQKKIYKAKPPVAPKIHIDDSIKVTMLQPVEVLSQYENHPLKTAKLGINTIGASTFANTPVMFGENDVVKTLQILPGVSESTEGLAGMNVHGGNADENMLMLDNVPFYQAEHFAGLFSPFNSDILKYVDFYKTSVPARFDGRLSSFLDARLKNGNRTGHHGSARLGLTSGAFNISGPIGEKTTYLVGLRRSWYDILTTPVFAILNAKNKDEKYKIDYHFMDFNARIEHQFSDRLSAFINAYYGDDLMKTTWGDKTEPTEGYYYMQKYRFNWGNILAQGGVNYQIRPELSAEFSAAFTRYFSSISYNIIDKEIREEATDVAISKMKNSDYINDFTIKGDFNWNPYDNSNIKFGAGYIRHYFLPNRTFRENIYNDTKVTTREVEKPIGANEVNAYIEDDWRISERLHAEGGVNASLFNIESKVKWGLSPRFAFSYYPISTLSLKAAYSRTVQYVHKTEWTYISLPCDKWVPVAGNFKPMTADKVGIGGYWQTPGGDYAVTLEGYWKFMHNLLEYRDEYYLYPVSDFWNDRLTDGKGTSKGIDVMLEKKSGKLTGHVSYSLGWSDRQFADRNDGRPYPARFDHRHTIKLFLNWSISRKVSLNALWIGHSGNRFTLLPQRFEEPDFTKYSHMDKEVPLKAPINNYQLPFYHRLDLSCTVKNSRGYWTFSLYNAYCNMNTIAITTGYTRQSIRYTPVGENVWIIESQDSKPVFQKFKLLPIIPSVSYTWQF